MRLLLILVLALSLALFPLATYEALQKTAESAGISSMWMALSCAAEAGTPWHPRTGWSAIDHVEHEWNETRLFWRLTARSILDPTAGQRDVMPVLASSFALAIERVDR